MSATGSVMLLDSLPTLASRSALPFIPRDPFMLLGAARPRVAVKSGVGMHIGATIRPGPAPRRS